MLNDLYTAGIILKDLPLEIFDFKSCYGNDRHFSKDRCSQSSTNLVPHNSNEYISLLICQLCFHYTGTWTCNRYYCILRQIHFQFSGKLTY